LQNIYLRKVGQYGLRKCLPGDIPQVIAINWAALPEHYSDSFFEERLKESPETFLVAEDESGKITAYIMCRIEYGFSNTRRYGLARKGHIVSVAVLDQNRRAGLGRALVEEGVQGMKQRGCSEAYLEVRTSNEPAIALYTKLGFRTIATHRGYYRDGEDANLMSRQI
jgi:[ribosomal protein S18]-alanine N-acetyltransferase